MRIFRAEGALRADLWSALCLEPEVSLLFSSAAVTWLPWEPTPGRRAWLTITRLNIMWLPCMSIHPS
uniref:Alternative protein BTD n=1 Tax=Homo sapiens TaxID=9606 RepID=L0R6D3_HUMAN|nr:alternative protein BTD [Homo sapiens]